MSRYGSDASYGTGFAGEEEKPERAGASEREVKESRHSTEKAPLIGLESKYDRDTSSAMGSRATDTLPDPFTAEITGYEVESAQGNWLYKKKLFDHSEYGWKIHVALERDQRNVQLAWEQVIQPILLKLEIKLFKITTLQNLNNAESEGKACTIYLYDETRFRLPRFQSGIRACCGRFFSQCNDHIKFLTMLQELEDGLTERGIRATRKPELDHSIHGSQFLSYRNDHGILWREDKKDRSWTSAHFAWDVAQVEKEFAQPSRYDILDKNNPAADEDVYGLETIRLRPTAAPVMVADVDDEREEQEAVDLGMK